MDYGAYRRTTDAAAAAIRDAGTGASVVSLAGGYFGVRITVGDLANVIVCRDLDSDGEWLSWAEDHQGERFTDDAVTIGHVRPRDYASRLAAAAADTARQQTARH